MREVRRYRKRRRKESKGKKKKDARNEIERTMKKEVLKRKK